MNCLHNAEKRAWLGKYKGGMLYFLGCHLIDMVYRIMGEPEAVVPMNSSTGIDGVTSEDLGFVAFRYKNGVSFVKSCAAEAGGFLRRQLVVCGSKGTYEINPWEKMCAGGQISPTKVTLAAEVQGDWDSNKVHHPDCGVHDRYDNMMRAFAGIVRGDKNPYTYDYELNLFKLIMKCCGVEE